MLDENHATDRKIEKMWFSFFFFFLYSYADDIMKDVLGLGLGCSFNIPKKKKNLTLCTDDVVILAAHQKHLELSEEKGNNLDGKLII